MVREQTTWIGVRVGDCLIEDRIADGRFSSVYRGTKLAGSSRKAFKVAKSSDVTDPGAGRSQWATAALTIFEGGVTPVRPDSHQILAFQGHKLEACNDPALPTVEEMVSGEGLSYFRMEFLPGQSLRQLLRLGQASIKTFLEIARALARLHENPAFGYHGDLKPDNILVSPSGVRLLDPGYFGKLDCQEGRDLTCAITTPGYYPFMEPDDLFALGIMLWESVCRQHPLVGTGDSRAEKVTAKLQSWVQSYENVGQYFLSPILRLRRPSELVPGIPPEVEQVLLTGMRLSLDQTGRLERAPGFQRFTDLAESLEPLLGWHVNGSQ